MSMIKVNVNLLKTYNPVQLVKMAVTVQVISGALIALNYENISLVLTVILLASYMSMMAFIFYLIMRVRMKV
jgi:DHA1 family bicyclomycin/chloramphenicol resistance-like MFS transporter